MNSEYENIIIGCSSGSTQNVAISIIRISGNFKITSFQNLFSTNLSSIEPKVIYRSNIFSSSGEILDDVMFSYFQGPKSYTSENVIELFVHGNVLNVERIIESFLCLDNFRRSKPGEFTLRAFLNKKLSLNQVEGLDLLLNSNSSFEFRQGLQFLNGELSKKYSEIYDILIRLKGSVDILIDFSEDVGIEPAWKLYLSLLDQINVEITNLHVRNKNVLKSGVQLKIGLFGSANAGKSTFFNYLLADKRSIVSPVAGTTRDFISEQVYYQNTFFTLIDTAGIRLDTSDLIESEGIKRSLELFSTSFFKVYIYSTTDELDSTDLALESDVIVFTHLDQVPNDFFNRAILRKFSDRNLIFINLKSGSIEPDYFFGPGSIGPGILSGSIEPAIKPLRELILDMAFSKYKLFIKENPIVIDRHRDVISNIYKFMQNEKENLSSSDLGIISSKINTLDYLLQELVGIIPTEDVLNSIFENFCIGK